MKMKKFIQSRYQQILYSLLILLPSILTGNVYSLINEETSTTSMVSNISAISSSIYAGLDDAQNYAAYSLSLLLRHNDFVDFNIAGMSKHVSQFLYHNPTISNIYIIDQNSTILYGINDTQLSGTEYSAHVDMALNGRLGFYSDFVNSKPFTQFAFPIYNNQEGFPPHGAFVVTYSFIPIEAELKALNSSSSNLQGYLFDPNGRVLASSSNQSIFLQNRSVDIMSIRQGINFDVLRPFNLFDDTPVIGTYHILDDTGWTLLVTSSIPENLNYTDLISWLSGFLSLGGISSFEFIRKKKSNLISTILSESNSSDTFSCNYSNDPLSESSPSEKSTQS